MSERLVQAVHGRAKVHPDPRYEVDFARDLAARCTRSELLVLYGRFRYGEEEVDFFMRRACVRALAKRCGDGLRVGPGVGLRHPETFEIGDGVVIGDHTLIHGRFDGRLVIGDKVWVGPQAMLDARDLEIGDHVGWGPGAKVLGSTHTGQPLHVPIIATDLLIRPVVIEAEADIGVNAIILPGVRIGRGAIVGAGAIVTRDVPPLAKAAGNPARVIGQRCTPDAARLAP